MLSRLMEVNGIAATPALAEPPAGYVSTTAPAVTTPVETTSPTAEFILGDVTNDGIIDGRDASDVLTEYARTSTGKKESYSSAKTKAADVNSDNIIDGRDATLLLSYYAYISANHNITLPDYIKRQK